MRPWLSWTQASCSVTAEGPMKGREIPVKTPTTIHALLEFASGAAVTLGASWDVWAHRHRPMELYGTDGAIFVPDPNWFGGTVELAAVRERAAVHVEPTAVAEAPRGHLPLQRAAIDADDARDLRHVLQLYRIGGQSRERGVEAGAMGQAADPRRHPARQLHPVHPNSPLADRSRIIRGSLADAHIVSRRADRTEAGAVRRARRRS